MKVLITPRSFAKADRTPLTMLEEAGVEIVRNPGEKPLAEEELIPLLSGAAGIIIGIDGLTAKAIQGATSLKVISKYGVGTDNIDLAAATARGIPVTITPGANAQAVADLTIGLMLAVARRIPFADRLVREGSWSRVMGRELGGKILGLIGVGRIGREVARRAAGFDMKLVGFDIQMPLSERHPGGATEAATPHSTLYTDLDELLACSDFISIHVPLNESTRNLIGEPELRRMKREAILINTSRGGIVDERALVRALTAGWIAGAALDVYVEEPPTDKELKALPNVVLTPHMGAHTEEAVTRMGHQAARNLIDALRGTVDPEVVVNKGVLR